ncbi:tetratricopeptide repeat protein [uncultured Caulobacter sp.]|uniref:tetratricopeptide repeat protein n=1 Tax=uncultured Caulobacter sp. TaxID=158749 RepID=UPI00262DC445|nr:tetratricopeptide repeat protein [uncultured Caulobacter sp.]
MRAFSLAVCAVLALGGAHAVAGDLVIGSGSAQECSDAAQKGRSDNRSVLACTTALEVETLNFRDRARTFVNRGVLQMRQRQFAAARADFDQANTIDPNLGEAYVNRGATFVGESRYQEGVQQIDKGLALGVKEPEKAFFNRGLANEGLGDLKAAYKDYSRAAELKPDWPAPKTELARFTVKRP